MLGIVSGATKKGPTATKKRPTAVVSPSGGIATIG